jgi:uncharacterized protein YbcI
MDAINTARDAWTLDALISCAVIRRISGHTGRGPTQIRTVIDDDTIVCVARHVSPEGEETVVDSTGPEVRRTRDALQAAMSDDLVADIQRLTGREAAPLFRAQEVFPGVTCAVFLLQPLDSRR